MSHYRAEGYPKKSPKVVQFLLKNCSVVRRRRARSEDLARSDYPRCGYCYLDCHVNEKIGLSGLINTYCSLISLTIPTFQLI